MSRDFSPRMHWFAYLAHKEIYTCNIEYHIKGLPPMKLFTDEELADHNKHITVYVLTSDIYKTIRKLLSEENFNKLETMLVELTKADTEGKDTSSFPAEVTDWYYNRKDYYYHEPNDEDFLEWVKGYYK